MPYPPVAPAHDFPAMSESDQMSCENRIRQEFGDIAILSGWVNQGCGRWHLQIRVKDRVSGWVNLCIVAWDVIAHKMLVYMTISPQEKTIPAQRNRK